MIRVVLDTNILISASLTPHGLPAQVLLMCVADMDIELCVSGAVYAEYEEAPAISVSSTTRRRSSALRRRRREPALKAPLTSTSTIPTSSGKKQPLYTRPTQDAYGMSS